MRIAIAGPRRGSVQLTCSGRRARLHAAVHLVIPSGVDFFFLIYPAVGLVSGLLAGLLGIGGGLVIVPALLFILPHQGVPGVVTPHVAVATSLATVIVTSMVATHSHHRRGAVQWPIVWRMGAGLALGALAGAFIADALPGTLLKTGFGLFALFVALVMALRIEPPAGRPLSGIGLMSAGAVIGQISALIGIGGGTMTVPLLRWSRLPLHQAIATSSACGLPIALGGTLGFSLLHKEIGSYAVEYIHWSAALGIGVASLVSAPLGVRLAHRLSTPVLTRVFAFFLALVALRLLGD